jgi:hypothetical protein
VNVRVIPIDSVASSADFNALLAELGIAIDSPSARYLWEIIDTAQPGVWQVKATDAGTQWVNIGTDVNPTWVVVKTAP